MGKLTRVLFLSNNNTQSNWYICCLGCTIYFTLQPPLYCLPLFRQRKLLWNCGMHTYLYNTTIHTTYNIHLNGMYIFNGEMIDKWKACFRHRSLTDLAIVITLQILSKKALQTHLDKTQDGVILCFKVQDAQDGFHLLSFMSFP